MPDSIISPEIRPISLQCCQWRLSFCMVRRLRGQQGGRPPSVKTCATFPAVSSPSRCLLLQKAPHCHGAPREAWVHVLFDFHGYYSYYFLISFLGEEPAGSSHAEVLDHARSSWNYTAATNSLLRQPCRLSRSFPAIRMKNCQVPTPKILPAPSSALQPRLA